MPVIQAHLIPNGNVEGAAHGATTSLILGHSEPGYGPWLRRHPFITEWLE